VPAGLLDKVEEGVGAGLVDADLDGVGHFCACVSWVQERGG
jgi:hypothetical protein